MAHVVVAPTASDDLAELILSRHLPRNTRARVKARLSQLAEFPRGGSELEGRWNGFRYVLGPWRWMLIVYTFDEKADQVSVVTVQDARSAHSATSEQ
jgi:mRNA-degrading endonuclease RelE of RelBE toxin-antitoxin system